MIWSGNAYKLSCTEPNFSKTRIDALLRVSQVAYTTSRFKFSNPNFINASVISVA